MRVNALNANQLRLPTSERQRNEFFETINSIAGRNNGCNCSVLRTQNSVGHKTSAIVRDCRRNVILMLFLRKAFSYF